MGDKKQLKQIYEHFGNTMEEDEFVDMYKYATSKPYGFLYIDTDRSVCASGVDSTSIFI